MNVFARSRFGRTSRDRFIRKSMFMNLLINTVGSMLLPLQFGRGKIRDRVSFAPLSAVTVITNYPEWVIRVK